VLFSSRFRVRIRFSVLLVSGYAHVFVRLFDCNCHTAGHHKVEYLEKKFCRNVCVCVCVCSDDTDIGEYHCTMKLANGYVLKHVVNLNGKRQIRVFFTFSVFFFIFF